MRWPFSSVGLEEFSRSETDQKANMGLFQEYLTSS